MAISRLKAEVRSPADIRRCKHAIDWSEMSAR